MKIKLEDGSLKIDITELVGQMSEEACQQFYQNLAFEETILRACMDLLVSDYAFDDGYHSTTYGVLTSRLGDRLKAKCLPLMDKASQELIKNLQNDLKYQSEQHEKYRTQAWAFEREVYDLKEKLRPATASAAIGEGGCQPSKT